jgi:hypothetical protein
VQQKLTFMKVGDGGGGSKGKGRPDSKKGGGRGSPQGKKGGKGKGGKGASFAAPSAAGGRIRTGWNGPDSFSVDGKNYAIKANDGSNRSINDVLGLANPLCWPWCAKEGACMRREHEEHVGDDAAAHAKVENSHRQLMEQYFLME